MNKRRNRPVLTTLALAALLAHGAAGAGAPRTSLTVLPAAPGIVVNALNDAGQVVGSRFTVAGVSVAFLWSADTGMTALAGLPSDDSHMAHDINNLGQVVGSSTTLGAFVWSPGSGVVSLQGPNIHGVAPSARSINDLGVVVGDNGRPVVWDALGGARELAGNGRAMAINNLGQIAVSAILTVSDSGWFRYDAYRWDSSGAASLLSVPADREAVLQDMNNRGDLVGTLYQNPGGERRGMLWRADLTPVHLAGLSQAHGINDAQQVVGRLAGGGGSALWRNGSTTRLDSFATAGFTPSPPGDFTPVHINALAQVAGVGITAGGEQRAFLLTLHPDWTGGDGAWNDSTGTRWNWAGTGTAAARVGAAHDVVIDPGRSATITGAAEGRARSVQLGGTSGTVVTLNLSGGTTTLGDGDGGYANPSAVRAGGAVTGSGRLVVGETLHVQAGGRVEVGAGQLMQLQADELRNGGRIQVLGTAAAPAELQLSGWRYHFTNDAAGQVLVQYGTLRLGGGLQNFGRVSVQSARLLADETVLNHADAQLSFSFGESVVDAVIDNRGLLVVSNGARASFHGAIDNPGELRISSGGAANFFGEVLISGSFTGGGDAMFEGGVTLPFGQTVQMGPHTTLAGATLRLVGSADGLALGDRVDVFDWFTGVEGRFTALALPSLADGLVWDTSDLYAGGTLAVAAVPEPGTWALWLAGAAALAGLQRRRRAVEGYTRT